MPIFFLMSLGAFYQRGLHYILISKKNKKATILLSICVAREEKGFVIFHNYVISL